MPGSIKVYRQSLLLAIYIARAVDAFAQNAQQLCVRGAPYIMRASMRRHYFNSFMCELDDFNMNDLLFHPSDGKAVLVDACSSWCGPCKLIEPYLFEAAKKYSQHLSVIKYDVENTNTKNLKVEMLLKGVLVRGLPTLILYNNGAPLATHSGAMTEQDLFDWLDVKLATIPRNQSVKDEEREANSVSTGGKRGFVSFADRYSL